MKSRFILPVFCFIFSISFSQDYFPEGVSDAESWYIVDYEEIEAESLRNHSAAHIDIKRCYPEFYYEKTFIKHWQ